MSKKQLDFIERLARKLNTTGLEFAKTYFFNDVITTLEELNKRKITKLIKRLKDHQIISQIKQIETSKFYTIDRINEIFNKEFKDYSELTEYYYGALMDYKIRVVCKDHPLENTIDYEYGYNDSPLCEDGKLYYLKFYELLVLDYDGIPLDEVLNRLQEKKYDCLFYIYQTAGGYHVYLVSELIHHRSAIEFMKSLKCDYMYIKYAYTNGFKIRLSKKLNRDEPFLENYVQSYGKATLCDDAKKLLEIRKRFIPD
jgi:hypothetical protein